MVNLFQDQIELIGAATQELRVGRKRVLLQAATGSGKSVMAAEIVRRCVAKGQRAWFCVPRRELLRQISGTLTEAGVRHGMIASGQPYRSGQSAYVCSIETLRRRLERVEPPRLVVIDETHFGDGAIEELIEWCRQRGIVVIGLSATPWRLSGRGLGKWYESMVLGKSIAGLIEAGRLSDYRPFAPGKPSLDGVRVVAGDYAKGQLAERMEGDRVLIGDAIRHYKDHASGKLAVAYCVSIGHSKQVVAAFTAAGVKAQHIDGSMGDAERRAIIERFASREYPVLSNCELLTFGFDLASQVGYDVTVEAMIDLRPTKSLALQMQKWGRVLRRKPEPAIILDHANNFTEHGFPDDERVWTLEDRPRGKGGKGGERIMPVKECHECYFCHRPAPSCPNCGTIYPVQGRKIEEIEGELVEIQRAERRKEIAIKKRQCKTLADFQELERELGYKSGWAHIQAKLRGIA